MSVHTRLFIADLTHLDCAWFDPVAGLLGDTWRVDAEVGGELADDDMLCDFGVIKATLKRALDADIDHRLLLDAEQSRALQAATPGHAHITLHNHAGQDWHYSAPDASFAPLDLPTLSEDTLASVLAPGLLRQLPDNITDLTLRLTPAHSRGPYRYCHGLRRHAGNCQRMAHGHRARLDFRVDGQDRPDIAAAWQARFDRRYLGSEQDLSSSGARHRYRYHASQGDFELELPASRSCPIPAEPTIEQISAYLVRQVANDHPGRAIECRAFEGIGKGAISDLDERSGVTR